MKQAGSAVRPDKLRFDFTHPQPLTPEERERVERIVNEKVFEAIPVRTFVTPIEEARKLGAMMLFGEKYGDEVRVVEIDGFSRELCGGTHVRSTAEIGPFVILSERLGRLGRAPDRGGHRRRGVGVLARPRRASSTRVRGRARAGAARGEEAEGGRRPARDVEPEHRPCRATNVIVMEVKGVGGSALLDLSDRFKQRERAGGGRARARARTARSPRRRTSTRRVAGGSTPVTSCSEIAPIVGGGGGGRPTMAEAGGKDADEAARGARRGRASCSSPRSR